ncbi:UPF0193 protein EVG1 homolog isoform X1 [Helicoverpa zea]|uniref:UPF0193 protein EVG1 homolog isoform X1 n=1 Tax=Helicoverpa zea TaxID=7113 RepID=UPI001F581F46|nr:UPF0193 protein EVG1 homolog isoform X1 [Helicoverpa zea]
MKMLKPDDNGFVNITWPSKNVPHGGIFHTRVAEPTENQRELLKVLLEESKLTIAQRQKSAFKLRAHEENKSDRELLVRMPVVRPRTSRRRSLSTIRESGVFDADRYRPLKRGEDREKMKERLANTMAYGDDQEQRPKPPPAISKKPQPQLPTNKQMWHELVTQIRERTEWLAEMEYLGQAAPHRDIIKDQIAERMRALDALGIDSECSTPKSTDSGFSTRRSREPEPVVKRRSSAASGTSSQSNKSEKKRVSPKSSTRARNKEENVASYSQLSPLQYSPRRRQ